MAQVKISADFSRLQRELKKLSGKALSKPIAKAINKAMRETKVALAQKMTEEVNLPLKGNSAGGKGRTPPGTMSLIQVKPVKESSSVDNIDAAMKASLKSHGLIHFVEPKEPQNQKGVPVKSRPPIIAQVKRGQFSVLKRHFPIRGQGGSTVMVFRKDKRSQQAERQPDGSLRVKSKEILANKRIASLYSRLVKKENINFAIDKLYRELAKLINRALKESK